MQQREDRGWQKAGGLDLPKPGLPPSSGSTRMSSSTSSTTTGSPRPANGQQSVIGLRPGGHGVVAKPIPGGKLRDPAETTAAIVASLPPPVQRSLLARYEDRVDDEYGWDGGVIGYGLLAPLAELPRDEALKIVTLWMEPLRDHAIFSEIVRLRASCKARPEEFNDQTMVLRVLAEECAEYPADIVIWVLRQWARREVFTPTLAELRDDLQRAARSRRGLAAALAPSQRVG